jgi:hypothetical protein
MTVTHRIEGTVLPVLIVNLKPGNCIYSQCSISLMTNYAQRYANV